MYRRVCFGTVTFQLPYRAMKSMNSYLIGSQLDRQKLSKVSLSTIFETVN